MLKKKLDKLKAYNLPAKNVLQTVGPMVNGRLTHRHKTLLESCYSSCLDLASQIKEIKNVAFCCISTGVFGYPKEESAGTAVEVVHNWSKKNPGKIDRIIFNVYTEEDYEIYQRLI